MADDDKEKAEKLAAAKKKYEQLKKQKQKDGKKTGAKKTADKAAVEKKPEEEVDTQEAAEKPEADVDAPEAGDSLQEKALDDAPEPVADTTATTTQPDPADVEVEPDSFAQELHRQQATRIEELEQENKRLKQPLASGTGPADTIDEVERLRAQIRDLEAENYDLKKGIWREKRGDMQSSTDQDGFLEYEDVDLSSPYGPRSSSISRPAHSTLQDVINSGISAFTGRPLELPRKGSATSGARPRKQSLGLMSEDGFDEEAFRLAQEEEAKRRIERVKDVKRALPQWKGWRLDLVELRQAGIGGGREVGPIFEV